LLKYTNAVKSIDINFIDKESKNYNFICKKYEALNNNDTLYTLDTCKLTPYFTSFAIPNNVSVQSLQLLYTYLYNFDIISKRNLTIYLIHHNGYRTYFNTPNDIVFSSLDVNEID
jgi:transposase-like protein